jgi:hypothetical protein
VGIEDLATVSQVLQQVMAFECVYSEHGLIRLIAVSEARLARLIYTASHTRSVMADVTVKQAFCYALQACVTDTSLNACSFSLHWKHRSEPMASVQKKSNSLLLSLPSNLLPIGNGIMQLHVSIVAILTVF